MGRKVYGISALMLVTAVIGPGVWCSAAEVSVMDEVVVTAGRIEQPKKDVTANITIVSREDIEQAAARDVGDLIAQLGLGHIQKYPSSLTSIGIRGFRTDTHGNDLQGHVLVLLDGRRAGTGNVAKILTRNIERIEIIRGPGAVQYGSSGIGGVVNIITRRGSGNSAMVEAGAGSFGEFEGTVGGTALKNNFDFAGTLTLQTMDDYDTGAGITYDNTGYDMKTGISVNTGYSFAKGNRVGLVFTGFKVDEDGNPGYIGSIDQDDYTDKSNYSVDLRYDGRSADAGYQWMARYFFGQDENEWSFPSGSNPDGWDFDTTSSNDTNQQGAQLQASGSFGMATLTAGFDWVKYKVENSWTPEETDYSNPALFLLGKAGVLEDRLALTAGLRYDWYDVEVTQPAGRDESESHFTPSIGLAWLVIDTLKLRARYAEGFVMPSAEQLAADYWNWGTRTVGNTDLDPETSRTYEAGVDYSKAGFVGSFTYFITDFDDKITTSYLFDGSQTWVNLGSASIDGLELEASYDLGVPLDLTWELKPYLNMTLLTNYEDDETGEDLPYISGTTLSAGIVAAAGGDWFCRFNVVYNGSQDVNDWASGAFPVPVVKMDSFVVADLVGSYRFFRSEKYGNWSVRGEVRNLFDEDYAYALDNPMPGISFFAGLRWEY
jgi:vitamin B12 transporter